MDVIKIGGASGVNVCSMLEDLIRQWKLGRRFVLIHGGSEQTNRLADELSHPARFVTSPSGHQSRRTDRKTLEIFIMATAAINRRLVSAFQSAGVDAVGLSGLDGRLVTARRKKAIRSVEAGRVRILRDEWTGTPREANVELLQLLLASGYLPVIAPVAASETGEPLNVDGDRAAALIARALRAECLIFFTNVPGLLRHFPDPSSLVRHVPADQMDWAMELAQERMKKKVLAAREALSGGVRRAIIADSRIDSPVEHALGGLGTCLGEPLVTAEPPIARSMEHGGEVHA